MSTTTTTYNGWENYETWLVFTTYQQLIEGLLPNHADSSDYYTLAESLKEQISEVILEPLSTDHISFDLTSSCLSEVNWKELVESHFSEV